MASFLCQQRADFSLFPTALYGGGWPRLAGVAKSGSQSPAMARLGYSLSIALCSALFAILFSMALLFLARRLAWQHHRYCANLISNMGMIVLAIPTLVVALGLFIRLQAMDFQPWHLLLIVAFCNGILAMPFVIRTLSVPMYQNMQYERLCQSLGVQGWQRWKWVEWQAINAPMRYAFALACALSLGGFHRHCLIWQSRFYLSAVFALSAIRLISYAGSERYRLDFIIVMWRVICAD